MEIDQNGIATRQNELQSLKFACAARYFYKWVQRIRAYELVLAVLIPVILSVIATLNTNPNVVFGAALYGFVLTMVDAAVFYPLQKSYQVKGAQCQEYFDSYVLIMPPSPSRLSGAPDLEEVEGVARPFVRDDRLRPFKNWYSTRVAVLPLALARLVCQRTNCNWDAGLRTFYLGTLIGITLLVVIVLLAALAIAGWSLEKFILALLFPISPALVWAIREFYDQLNAKDSKVALRDVVSSIWDQRLKHHLSDAATETASNDVQAALFAYRSTSPPIPNLIYQLCRPRFQDQMNEGAGAWVEQALKA